MDTSEPGGSLVAKVIKDSAREPKLEHSLLPPRGLSAIARWGCSQGKRYHSDHVGTFEVPEVEKGTSRTHRRAHGGAGTGDWPTGRDEGTKQKEQCPHLWVRECQTVWGGKEYTGPTKTQEIRLGSPCLAWFLLSLDQSLIFVALHVFLKTSAIPGEMMEEHGLKVLGLDCWAQGVTDSR